MGRKKLKNEDRKETVIKIRVTKEFKKEYFSALRRYNLEPSKHIRKLIEHSYMEFLMLDMQKDICHRIIELQTKEDNKNA